jgi:hypothetical protein
MSFEINDLANYGLTFNREVCSAAFLRKRQSNCLVKCREKLVIVRRAVRHYNATYRHITHANRVRVTSEVYNSIEFVVKSATVAPGPLDVTTISALRNTCVNTVRKSITRVRTDDRSVNRITLYRICHRAKCAVRACKNRLFLLPTGRSFHLAHRSTP